MAVVSSAPMERVLGQRIVNTSFSTSLNDPLMTVGPSYNEKSSLLIGDENLLVVSPYLEEAHLLDLRTVDIPNQLLAKALVGLKCLRPDYATAPYVEIFNWADVVEEVRKLAKEISFKWEESFFYIVVFRSQIPPTTVYEDLGILDKAAHAEATESGGFLK
jgi:hypothetical protein